MDKLMQEMAQRVIDNNESPYDDQIIATVDGYEFEMWKDSECDDEWYIRVCPEGEGYLYDGWFSESSDKSEKDAVIEAIRGAGIFDEY